MRRILIKNNRGSYYINVPKEHVRGLRWKDGQHLDVDRKGKTLIITDWSK